MSGRVAAVGADEGDAIRIGRPKEPDRAADRAAEVSTSIAVGIGRDGGWLVPGQLAALQREAGNRAVSRLLTVPAGTGSARSAGSQPARRRATFQRDVADFLRSAGAGRAATGSLGTTAGKRSITAHFFPGTSSAKALVIGGVHGSEVSGIAVAEELVKRLSAPGARRPFFSVVIVPSLFPDNLAARRAWEATLKGPLTPDEYEKARTKAKDPGRISAGQEDPNRQMPARGADFDPKNPTDALGRVMETENQALLELIRRFQPSRIASLHAIKEPARAGVFADPHPTTTGSGTARDQLLASGMDALALDMARRVAAGGGRVAGNELGTKGETSLYPGQNPKMSADQIARENKKGTTLGQWGPSRGIGVITVEVPEQYDAASPVTDPNRVREIEAHAEALEEIFLGPPPGAALIQLAEQIAKEIKAAAGSAVGAIGEMFGAGGGEGP